ncbi:MAG: hypothetical protein OHK93_002615 [Ramalina farinacea]|uniref:C2H2-type domain-containing protein n=1 Tax=Ramalina farinacea TaxID=258253 RepID=A0AA43QRP6_9LECA|nr:hypothetical protein [Ramalina farinacea]
MDLSRTASEEAQKIVHEVSTSELLNPHVSRDLQLKLQDSLRRSLESLAGRYQDNLQRALASLNFQNKDGDVRGRESEDGKVAIDEERHKCLDCNKVKKTHSDLKKHVLRHSRPYTCTDENCQLSFGSKNDWKRHERTIHDDPSLKQAFWCALRFDSIQDMFNQDKVMTSLDFEVRIDRSFDGVPKDPMIWEDDRCLELDVPNTELCQFVAWKKEDFYEHLYTKHGVIKPVLSSTQPPSSSSLPHSSQPIPVSDPPKPSSEVPSHYIAAKKARKDIKMQCHVGRNGTNGFWCGFCNKVITIDRTLRGAPAWDARYKHIDEYHFREAAVKYFEEATRAVGVEGGNEQRSARGLSQSNKGKQAEEQQPWLPRRKGELWVVLSKGRTKGRLRYEEEKRERDKLVNGSNSDESEEEEGEEDDDDIDLHEIASHSGNSETAAHHGGDHEAAATHTTTMLGQDHHPSNITHPSTTRRAPLSPLSPHPDPPPPPGQPTSPLPISSNYHHYNEIDRYGTIPLPTPRAPSQQQQQQQAPLNESILDEDVMANLGTTNPPIQQTQTQPHQRHRHTRSAASAAAKLRWWRCE